MSLKNIFRAVSLFIFLGSQFAQGEVSSFSEQEVFNLKKAGEARDLNSPLFTAFLQSSLAYDRVIAVQVLGQTRMVSSISLFKSRLLDSSPNVRSESCFALGEIGIQNKLDAETIQSLKNRWTDTSELVRAKCFEAFGRISPDDTYQNLTEQMTKQTPKVTAAVLMAAFRARYVRQINHPEQPLFDWSPEFVDAYVAWATEHLLDNQDVAEAVAYTAYLVGPEKAMPLLSKLATVEKENVGIFVARSLSKFKVEPAYSLLKQIARVTKNKRVQVQALQALTTLKVSLLPTDQLLFEELLKDPSYHLRNAALENAAVAEFSLLKESVLNSVETHLSDSSTSVKNSSLNFLANYCAKNRDLSFCQNLNYGDLMLEFLQSPNWVIRQNVVNQSSIHPDPKMIVSVGLADADLHVRSAAIDQLAQFDTSYALNKLTLVIDLNRLDEKYSIALLLSSLPIAKQENLYSKKLAYLDVLYNNSGFVHFRDVREVILDFLIAEVNLETTELLKQYYLKETVYGLSEKIKIELNRRNVIFALIQIENSFSKTPFLNEVWSEDTDVLLTTTKGPIKIKFYKEAYFHVADFLGWVKAKKYDGTLFHRVISNFVAQGAQAGTDQLNYFNLRSEINSHPFERGTIGMPRASDFDSGGGGPSLFINHIKTPHLDGMYTVLGQVTQGMDTVDNIEIGDLVLKAEIIKE